LRAYAKEIEKRSDEIARTISREMGKVAWDAKGEVAAMIGKIEISIRAQAERAGAREEKAAFGAMTLSHHAHGVLGVFGPFNFPGHLPNGHIVPALLAGNCVLFKPSEVTPGVALFDGGSVGGSRPAGWGAQSVAGRTRNWRRIARLARPQRRALHRLCAYRRADP
jgi:delta 1-pyrroline-5-carboxylate dehydrogenase